ncbi:DUF58 domain-containing protein [Candidatus Saccharibacteria bacterium]|nr:DUF58 domain-containing protein [Candidatus Saccharibacteria bacterium]
MGIDILNYQQLEQAESVLVSAQTQIPFGRFGFGDELGQKIGVGFEPDGVRDYLPSDDSRFIDWAVTAKRGDGGISLRQFYEDQNALTVVVSDVPTVARYADTIGDPMSAMSLGLVVANIILKDAAKFSPVMASWTNGFESSSQVPIAFDGRDAAKKASVSGLESAISARKLASEIKTAEQSKGLFRRKTTVITPGSESILAALDRARTKSKRIADAARFIIISDFKVGDEVFDLMSAMKKQNEVVALQLTNPLMRELDPRVRVVRSSDGRDVTIETQEQRDRYNAKVIEIARKREEKLRTSSTGLFVVDTMNPRIARVA